MRGESILCKEKVILGLEGAGRYGGHIVSVVSVVSEGGPHIQDIPGTVILRRTWAEVLFNKRYDDGCKIIVDP